MTRARLHHAAFGPARPTLPRESMAKWLAVLLLLVLVAAGVFYVWVYQPQREALAATQAQLADRDARAAEQDRQLEELKARVGELQEEVAEKEKGVAALRSAQDESTK